MAKNEENRNAEQRRAFEDCSIRAVEGEGNERKFTLSFSSEEPYERWFGVEILSHKDGAVDLSRLKTIGVVLYNHNRDEVIGKITKAWIEDNRGCAEIEFDDDDASEVIRKKVASGTLKGVSVGYRVDVFEEVKEGQVSADGHKGPCSVATKWTPFEISIVSVPADPTVGVGRSQEDPEPQTKGASRTYFARLRLNINKNKVN